MNEEFERYGLGDKIVYLNYGTVRTGRIEEIIITNRLKHRHTEVKRQYRVLPLDTEKDWTDLVDEDDILYDSMQRLERIKKLTDRTNKYIAKFYGLHTKIKRDLQDIIKYRENNDWRIAALEKFIDSLDEIYKET